MSLTPDSVRAALARIHDPNVDTDLMSAQSVRGVGVDGGKVAIELQLGYPAAGWRDAYNILEGFEGDIDARRQRGKLNGWRLHDLPWEQD